MKSLSHSASLEQKVVSLITTRWQLQHDDILPTILQFMEHCYIKRKQAAAYKLEREAIEGSENKALLQVDFSENYMCQYQDEMLSAHWQVTLSTAALWHTGMLHPIILHIRKTLS